MNRIRVRFVGTDRRGNGRAGLATIVDTDLSEWTRYKYTQGWQSLTAWIEGAHADPIAAITAQPDSGERIWWAGGQ